MEREPRTTQDLETRGLRIRSDRDDAVVADGDEHYGDVESLCVGEAA